MRSTTPRWPLTAPLRGRGTAATACSFRGDGIPSQARSEVRLGPISLTCPSRMPLC
jgi:hypothetical protein